MNTSGCNKADLVDAVLRSGAVRLRKDAVQVVEAVFERMAKALEHDGTVFVQGFGTLSVQERKGVTVKLPPPRALDGEEPAPANGREKRTYPPRTTVRFRPHGNLLQRLPRPASA